MDDFQSPDSDYYDYLKKQASKPSLVDERNHPNHWFNRSADLHASARVLWLAMNGALDGEDKDAGQSRGYSYAVACNPVYYMLCGLSLELIMKALLIQNGVAPDNIKTHKFERLLQLLNHSVDKKTRKLLQFYEAMAVWEGRYPTPVGASDQGLIDHWKLSSEVLTSPVKKFKGLEFRQSNGAGDWDNFHALWRSFADKFTHS